MAGSETLRAALWMIGAIVAFSSMAVAGRELASWHDTFEIMAWRSLVGIAITGGAALLLGRRGELRTRRPGLHLIRNLLHFGGQNLWFFAIATIPLAQVFAFEFSSPVWAALAAPLVLGERLTRMRLIAVSLGFAGILLVARPGTSTLSPGTVAALLAAFGFAGSALTTRLLTRTESILCILFWMTVLQAGFGFALALADGATHLPTARSGAWLALVGVAGLVAHYSLTRALSLAPAAVVMPVDFVRLPLIALVGMVLYGEPLDPWVLAGAAVIITANLLNLRSETHPRRRALR